MSILRIVRGLPGSGKSTFAKKFGVVHFEADMFHMKDDEYNWIGSRTKQAHEWCFNNVRECMILGMDVVVSNTFTELWEFNKYLLLGEEFGYDVRVIACTENYGNVHSVPEDVLKKMADRWQKYEGEEIV